MPRKALAGLARAESGVCKYPAISNFETGAVAGRTASENGEAGGHKRSLVSGGQSGRGQISLHENLTLAQSLLKLGEIFYL